MSISKKTTGLEHFSRLTQAVYIHEPSTASTSPISPNAPDLILLCTWMDASLRNIAKYTTGYAKFYPSTRILVITTTTFDAAFRTWTSNGVRIAPVLEILYALPPDARLLLHLFSDGGAFTTTLIAESYQAKIGKSLPATAMILDSAPGKVTYEATVRGFAVALPKNIVLRFLGIMVLRFFFGLYQLIYLVSRKDDLIERGRKKLNCKGLFGVDVPRMYVYSVKDEIVTWEHVEEHMKEAKGLGYVVDREKFVDSFHAGHLISDEKRYWQAVMRLWGSS